MIYSHAISALVSGAMFAFAAWGIQGWRMDAQLSQLKTEYAKAQVAALEKAHAETIRLQDRKDAAERMARARQSDLARDAAGARDERDRLRDELAATRVQLSGASCASVREHAATLNELFGECAASIEGLAGKAQGHAIDTLMLLDAWPTRNTP